MFFGAHQPVGKSEAKKLVARVNGVMEGLSFNPENTHILYQDLVFYPGARLFDVTGHEGLPPKKAYLVQFQDVLYVLDWTNRPIYRLNADVPLLLNADNARDYVRFFFMFTRGRKGRFVIVENVDDINWKEEPPPPARKAVGRMLQPLHVKEGSRGEGYVLAASMIYKDVLFSCEIALDPRGCVTMGREEMLVEDIPVFDDILAQ